jgi:hypothetical protein
MGLNIYLGLLVEVEDTTSISIISLIDFDVEVLPIHMHQLRAKHTIATIAEALVWESMIRIRFFLLSFNSSPSLELLGSRNMACVVCPSSASAIDRSRPCICAGHGPRLSSFRSTAIMGRSMRSHQFHLWRSARRPCISLRYVAVPGLALPSVIARVEQKHASCVMYAWGAMYAIGVRVRWPSPAVHRNPLLTAAIIVSLAPE